MNLQTQAKAIGDKVNVGFDPASLIVILLPLLADCFNKLPQTRTPKEYLRDHFDDVDNTFDGHLVRRCRAQTRRAAREDGDRKLGKEKLDAITVATFHHIMNSDDDTVTATMEECV